MADKAIPTAPVAPAFTKGQVKLIPVFGSIGNVVKDFDSKEVVVGSYRHSQTIDGNTYSWKCAVVSLTGVVKLVYDEYEGRGFWRMEGLVDNVAVVTNTRATLVALEEMAF